MLRRCRQRAGAGAALADPAAAAQDTAVIERLLPASIVSVEAFEDVPGEEPLAAEQHLIAGVVESRRGEFITARRCAREALKRLGHNPAPILSGDRSEERRVGK